MEYFAYNSNELKILRAIPKMGTLFSRFYEEEGEGGYPLDQATIFPSLELFPE